MPKPKGGGEGMGNYIVEKAYILRFVLDAPKSGSFELAVKNKATVDVH